MQIHVVLRMFAEIFLVVVDASSARWEASNCAALLDARSAPRWRSRMKSNTGSNFGSSIMTRRPLRIAKLHADVLPHFDADGAVPRIRSRAGWITLLLPIRLIPALHGERRRIGHRRGVSSRPAPAQSADCSAQRRKIGIVDIDGEQTEVIGRA